MYEQLVKALRCKGLHYEDCEKQGCKYIQNGWCDYYRLNIEAADAIEGLSRECKALYAMLGTHPDPKGELGDPGVPTEPPKEVTDGT